MGDFWPLSLGVCVHHGTQQQFQHLLDLPKFPFLCLPLGAPGKPHHLDYVVPFGLHHTDKWWWCRLYHPCAQMLATWRHPPKVISHAVLLFCSLFLCLRVGTEQHIHIQQRPLSTQDWTAMEDHWRKAHRLAPKHEHHYTSGNRKYIPAMQHSVSRSSSPPSHSKPSHYLTVLGGY